MPAGRPKFHLQRQCYSFWVICCSGQWTEGLPADTPWGEWDLVDPKPDMFIITNTNELCLGKTQWCILMEQDPIKMYIYLSLNSKSRSYLLYKCITHRHVYSKHTILLIWIITAFYRHKMLLYEECKPQKAIAKEASCSQRTVSKHLIGKFTWRKILV